MFYLAGHEVRILKLHGWLVDPSGVIDVWKYSLLRPEHARGPSRRTRGVIPTNSSRPPGWSFTGMIAVA